LGTTYDARAPSVDLETFRGSSVVQGQRPSRERCGEW
jgi:hypothetical protein